MRVVVDSFARVIRLFERDLEAVLFDMDGLMLDTERISMRAWQAGCADCGFTLTDAQFLEIIGHRESDCLRLIRGMHGDRFSDAALAASTREHYARMLESGVPVMRGLVESLELLVDAGVPMAVATSTHHAVAVAKLRRAGVAHFFRAVVGGDQAARGKPAPDLYLAAALSVRCVPARCLALEDSGPGLRAASAAGCVPVLIPDLKPPTPEVSALAHRVLGSMAEFAAALRLGQAGCTGR